MLRNRTTARRQPGGARERKQTQDNVYALSHPTTRAPARQYPIYGRIQGDTWVKSARGSVNLLKVPKGWALDQEDLARAKSAGAAVVHICDLETRRHYWATIEVIRTKGFVFDRGHGRQVGLVLEHWRPSRQQAEALAAEMRELKPLVWQGVLGL
jgi:hypothetical protein